MARTLVTYEKNIEIVLCTIFDTILFSKFFMTLNIFYIYPKKLLICIYNVLSF